MSTNIAIFQGSVQKQLNISLYALKRTPYQALKMDFDAQPHWFVSHVLTGEVKTTTKGQSFVARSGDVMIHPPYLPFSEYSSQEGTHEWFMFDARFWPNLDILRLYPVTPVVTLQSPARYSQTFEELLGVWYSLDEPFRELRAFSLSIQLLGYVLESWLKAGSQPRPQLLSTNQDRFTSLINYMNENLQDKLSRDDLARRMNLHPGYFNRIFYEAFGVAPMQMLRDMRLRQAQEMLETSDNPLDVIALTCGFNDTAYFCRVFYRHFQMTPGQYRQSARQAAQVDIYNSEALKS